MLPRLKGWEQQTRLPECTPTPPAPPLPVGLQSEARCTGALDSQPAGDRPHDTQPRRGWGGASETTRTGPWIFPPAHSYAPQGAAGCHVSCEPVDVLSSQGEGGPPRLSAAGTPAGLPGGPSFSLKFSVKMEHKIPDWER